jgi:hypothetical protein
MIYLFFNYDYFQKNQNRQFSRFWGCYIFFIQHSNPSPDVVILHCPGVNIIAWVSRVYAGVTPSQQGVLEITSLSSHLRGGYFELRRSGELEQLHPPHRQTTPLLAFLPTKARRILCLDSL